MYCGECGAKNKKGDIFCEECGSKLREVPRKEKQSSKEKTSFVLTKQKKIVIGVIIVALIGLFIGYKNLEEKYSPQTLAEQYLQAINNQDYNTIYNLQSKENSAFIKKADYIKALEKLIPEKNVLGTVRVGEPIYENGKLNAKVPFSSSKVDDATKGWGSIVNKSEVLNITMVHSGKKYLFFDTWEIKDESIVKIDTIDDYYMLVPKDTKITYGETSVTKSYIDTKKENKYPGYIYYKLPKVLKAETDVTFTLPDGLKVSKKITPSSYTKEYTLSLEKKEISEDIQEKLSDQVKKDVKAVFSSLANKKAFNNLKGTLSTKEKSEDFKEEYEERLEDLEEEKYNIKDFEITSSQVSSVTTGRKYLYEVRAYVKYEYEREYKNDNENYDRRGSSYFTFYYTYENGYKLVEIPNLPRF